MTQNCEFLFVYTNIVVNGVIIFIIILNIVVHKFRQLQEAELTEQKNRLLSLSTRELCYRFSLDQMQRATSNFHDELVIGEGGFGKVYKGTFEVGPTVVAIKRLKPMPNQGSTEFRAEIEMLSKLRHSHIVSLIGYCDDGYEMILVYEFMPGGTLADHLYTRVGQGNKSVPTLSWVQRLKVCIGAARGLDYLHTGTGIQHRIIHRDVKTTNILLNENLAAKISDFGLSKISPANQADTFVSTLVKGTFGYFDPYYFQTRRLTKKSDVYSFGVVLFEVLCGRPALDKTLDEEQMGLAGWAQHCFREGLLGNIIDRKIKEEVFPDCLEAFVKVAIQCLHTEPKHRPNMAEVVVALESALLLQEKSTDYPLPEIITSDDNQDDIDFSKIEVENADSEKEMVVVSKSSHQETQSSTRMTFTKGFTSVFLALAARAFPVQSDLVMASTESASKDSLKEFYIPDYIFLPSSMADQLSGVPTCPVLVFINPKSGGQLGGDLLVTYRSLLNKNQVFDLGKESPDNVLHRLYITLEKLKLSGDNLALNIQERLRLIVAGGDGTAAWLLSVVCDLKLSHPPPIATVPLGTGNNLPFAFGWGKKNPGTDRESVISFLNQVKKANEMKIDSWHIILRMKVPKAGICDPIAPLELPHSLHAFHRVAASDELNKEGYHTFRGGFWNYFSMGMDAQVSYAFHSERKLHPEKFKNQLVNQKTYAKLGSTQGWFSASLVHPSSKNIAQLAKVKIMKSIGEWQDLNIPSYIRSIVCLNLPSFSGGFNPWGTPGRKKIRDRDLTPLYVDDGLLEIVGFRDAWHGHVLLAPNGHGTRLAQARRIKFEFWKGAASETFMTIDGEPWKQRLPVDDDTVVVEISALGQVKMLAVEHCKAKSVYDPSTPVRHEIEEGDSSDEEEGRKFGAADTFRMPDEVDVSHLS